ncbi:hypothetical protein CI109_104009 [Kwoniella shandongensis]|uniref:GPI-anchored wall transfer protein n=1 Tax=Kwoniella shandongensis TaxID=1734106 RepID=A0A5M6BXI7_9TREE|nr:uncharacterized protein CI109_004106 [Kwoniella shandongensis]KAA5527567.1 hypothetical protein CI109_004106 [Kwoniella shandongensis]
MSDYKSAKEAFVADNPGASIWSINAVSLVAWTSYLLYATISRRSRASFTIDFLTSVLPFVIGVTTASTWPILFNVTLSTVSALFHFTRSTPQSSVLYSNINGDHVPRRQRKSAGQWLDESDSDEEPAEHASASSSTHATPIKLPSQVTGLISSHSSSPMSPSPSALSVEDPLAYAGSRLNKRRLSPQPSPDAHTVDILPTPEFPELGYDQATISPRDYPTRTNRGSSSAGGRSGSSEKQRLPFLSIYRAHMIIMTVICILAVDFEVFPRWQGKCEDFGTSLMDVGVGSFVFSLGLVSTKSLSPSTPGHRSNPILDILIALRKSAPILVLGIIRLLMVKGVEYPEHVTEYGVHWNFFFTLAFLPVLGVTVRPLRKWVKWSVLGVIISLLQQILLTLFNLQPFLLSPSRPNILAANKEGISSLPGYLTIFLIGVETGEHVLRLTEPPPHKTVVTLSAEEHARSHYEKRRTELVLELFGYGVAWWCALGGSRLVGGEVSRRLANTPYVFWVVAYNTTFLFGNLLLELILPESHIPPLLEAINKNGLVVFLVANLLTGLVNVSMETMYASKMVGLGVVGVYTWAVCGVAWILRGRRLKI